MLLPPPQVTSGPPVSEGMPLPSRPVAPDGLERGRAEFIDVVERQLAQCRRFGQALVVLSIGIDRVSTLDGQVVEHLASGVSHELWNRLRARTRAKDSVVRVAGLEFGVLLPGCRPKDAPGARQRLAVALGGVYALGSDPVLATVSIGLASHSNEVDTGTRLWAVALESRAGEGAFAPATVAQRRR